MEMKIDTQRIKSERAKRAWSQEHLAEAAGLGLRTIHRIEKTGAASLESIKALAAVLELDIEQLCVAENQRQAGQVTTGIAPAALSATIIYAFLTAMNFGAMILDIIYARMLSNNPPQQGASVLFVEVADSLLTLNLLVLLAGLVALSFIWEFKNVRLLFLSSIVLSIVIPLMLVPFVDVTQDVSLMGSIFRLLVNSVVAGLVFKGMWALFRHRRTANVLLTD